MLRARRRQPRIVTAYNDMLSAHQPLQHYPELIKMAARNRGGSAQMAGGVPAMCDGVTPGPRRHGTVLFSRDVIAMATAVALSHEMFDGALLLGVCDKIVPGLLIGALSYGHLPHPRAGGADALGLPNAEKARAPAYAEGKGHARGAARGRKRSPTTAPAPAPSTAPPTPTRCCWR